MATVREPLPQTPSPLRCDIKAGEHDDGLSAFAPVRPRLFGIAYRMLGSSAEADDMVQDVWLRWQSTNRNAVENPPAFLATATTRLCINLAKSAHSRRETSIGKWHSEPVDTRVDPESRVERRDALKHAALLLLEKLSPSERAAFVLVEAFDYSCRQIADILQLEEANVRQLVSRARKRIANGPRKPARSDEQRRFLKVFIGAAQKGDMAGLEVHFAEDIDAYSDRGGHSRATKHPVSGYKSVTTFNPPVTSQVWEVPPSAWVETNGQESLRRISQAIGVWRDAAMKGANDHDREVISN